MKTKELKEEFKKRIKEILSILKRNDDPEHLKDAVYISQPVSEGHYVKILTFQEMKLFDAPIKLLSKNKDIAKKYSEEYIHKKIVDLYHNLLEDEKKLNEQSDKLIDELVDSPIKEYFIVSEIENIRLLADITYTLIDSTIKTLKEEDLPFELPNLLFHKEMMGKNVIFTWVKATESEKAKELAKHNFLISFSLLKLFAPNFRPSLKGSIRPGHISLELYNKHDKTLGSSHSVVGEHILNNAFLNRIIYAQFEEAGIKELEKDTPIKKVVEESLYWFAAGLEEKYSSAKLLNFVTVLESVLKKDNEKTEIKRAISERGALLLTDDFEARKKARKELNEIYNIRSNVVHKGKLIKDNDISRKAGGYARAILIKLIGKAKEFKGDFISFIDYLDDLKLKGKKEK